MKKALSVLVEGNKNWIGGLYYKRNIIFSLLQNEEIRKKYRIIVFAKKEIFDWLKPLGNDFVLLDSKWYMSPKRFSFISKLLNIKFDFVGNPNEDRVWVTILPSLPQSITRMEGENSAMTCLHMPQG